MPTLLAPLMLFGAAAVSVPVVLHFFYKARYKPLPWAAMHFLKQAVEQTSRRLKFQEWILLALRCLLLLLIALALARPVARSAAPAGRGESVDAVFLIDNSFSMGARDAEKTRLERAKDAAAAVLETLPPRSTVQIYTSADRAALLGPIKRNNLDQARQTLKAIELSSESTDFLPGFVESLVSLSTGQSPAKEVYLFSDLQKAGFERQQGAVRGKSEEVKNLGNLVFVRCSNPTHKPGNAAIVDITMPTVIPHTGTRVPFDVLVKNTGSTPLKNLRVSLTFRDRPPEQDGTPSEKRDRIVTREDRDEEKVIETLEAGATVPVTLTAKLDVAGPRPISAKLTGDDLPGDNEFHRIILVRDKVNVIIIDGSPDARNPAEAGSHFIRNALAAVSDSQRKDYFIQPTVYTAEQASAKVLEGADVVYLVNVPSSNEDKPGVAGLSKSFIEALNSFVQAGGGLVIGCGDLVDEERYNKVFGSGGLGLLPFDLGDVSATAAEYPYAPAPESVEETSFLGAFRSKYAAVFRTPAITRMFRLNETGPGSTGGRVVARVNNGLPLVATRSVGDGEVILITTALDARWGDLPTKGDAFVPMTTYTLLYLTGRKVPGGNRTAGDVLSWTPTDSNRSFNLIKPDGSRVRLGPATAQPGQKLAVTTTDTAKAGVYIILGEGESESRGAAFAVNPDLRESQNLDVALDSDIEGYLGFTPTVISAGAGTEEAVGQQRIAKEYTEYFLLLLFVLLLLEAGWAWYCGKAF